MTKRIDVPGFCAQSLPTPIGYKLYGDRCVFSQLSTGDEVVTSSINLAEAIIMAVCEAESIDLSQTRFFDLQTRLGYPGSPHKSKPGIFEFEEIRIEEAGLRGGWKAGGWMLVKCPDEVVHDFQFDGDPEQFIPRAFEATF
jgi:hypothetical protein